MTTNRLRRSSMCPVIRGRRTSGASPAAYREMTHEPDERSRLDPLRVVALAALSTADVAWDNFVRKNPEETVMKWGWVLITLYMGPVAAALYVFTERSPCGEP
jgi:hypothetical protein